MFWTDRFVNQIIKSGKYQPFWVDDMKTPSGKIHVGALRGVIIHDLLYKVLKEKGKKVAYTYVINDMDSMDGFPVYLDRDKFYKYMGHPLVKIPSPVKGYSSYSHCYASEFIEVFKKIDCHPKVIWTSELYKKGKFDKLIKFFLDKTSQVRKVFESHYENFTVENYYPYMPICPSCGKVSTTRIYKWDGEYVHFRCLKNAVDYTQGCSYEGKVKPEKQNGKLPWKIEWPSHWKILGVTIEWAGKDHMTEGGSWELAAKLSKEILSYPTPHAELYEHVLTGGRKMSSSKGKGASAAEMAELIPSYLLRFLMVKVNYRQTIDFNPEGDTIPNLFDEYDQFAEVYYKKGTKDDRGRIWQLSQIDEIPSKKPFFPRFRDVANYMQLSSINLEKKLEETKGSRLTELERKILKERIQYAKLWLKDYAPKEAVFRLSRQIPSQANNLTAEQRKYLLKASELLQKKDWQPEKLQFQLYELAKKLKIAPKAAFQAIYLSLIGKTHGPKAGWFLLDQDKKIVIQRFKEVQK